ncbi:IS1595 family transposase, partial [Aquimarina sp. RZ0]|uniref:IS1595 family transposase n=1 Tax=Aquimarina sp. RZ0 TaxID=2607730 RepID=UPI0011F3ADCD
RERIAKEIADNKGKLKRGKGSQKQASILVMIESKPVEPSSKYKHKTNKVVGYIKMKLIDNLEKKTTNEQVKTSIDPKAAATTDGANNYNDLKEHLKDHKAVVIQDKSKTSEILPWVHIAISNAKRLLLDVHHSTGIDYLQSYLDEYCYKFNRRYFESIFDRAIIAVVASNWKIKVQNIR